VEAKKPTELSCNIVVWLLEPAEPVATGVVFWLFMMVVECIIETLERLLRALVEGSY